MKTSLKKLLLLFFAMLSSVGIAMAGEPTAFEIFEDFDDDSHFSQGGIVPDGWLSTGTYDYSIPYRSICWDAGFMPQSGEYIIFSMDQMGATRDEVLYTPLMKLAGGKEATISFFINAPGGTPAQFFSFVEVKAGTAQSLDAQTISVGATSQAYSEWTEVKFSFTPETDGEYCFSLAMKQSSELSRDHGSIAIDDVTITGYAPAEGGEVTPPAGEPTAFEIFEDFDDDSRFSQGGIVPDGWLSTGNDSYTTPHRQYALDGGVIANSGDYVLFSQEQIGVERNEVIYTPMMKLAGGKEATISFFIYAPGGSPVATFYSSVVVKAGTAQSLDAQTVELGGTTAACSDWTEVKYTFSPEADGEYCFSISLKETASFRDCGNIAIDDVTITGWAPAESGETPLFVELTVTPASTEEPTIFVGETYTTTVNVKATNLVGDITVQNISSEELTVDVETIPMSDAMSEEGYTLTLTATPAATTSTGATFELAAENLETPVEVALTWKAIEYAAITLSTTTTDLGNVYVGDTYTTTVNVKATNLVADIVVENISNEVLTTSAVTIPMAEAMSETGYDLVVTLVPADTELTTATFELNTENLKEVATWNATWTAIEHAVVTVAPEADALDEAVLGREYTVEVNVKATGLVGDINVANRTAGDYKDDVTLATDVIPMTEAMSEEGYNLQLTVTPTVMGRASIIIEFSTENETDAAYYLLQWNATTGMELLEPNQDNYTTAIEVPYFNTFDNYDNDYDGTTVVPKGWATVGSYPFFTASIQGLDAVTGNYYLVADESTLDNRDDRLYTPFFRLSTDYEYTISYYLYMPGNSGGGILRATDLQVTVGTEQDFDFHPVTMMTVVDESIGEWVKQEFTFKPQVSGAYCFAFTLNTDVNYSGLVAIEDFNITAPGLLHRPTAAFAFGGLFEIMESKMVVFEGQMVELTNLSKDAESYQWEVTFPNGETYLSEEETPKFEFNQSGEYSVKLTATNARASRSTSHSVTVEYINYKSEDLSIMTWNPVQDGLLERGLIPAFDGDGNEEHNYDFVTGYNRYYHKFAERFELPEGAKLSVTVLNTWMAHYKNCAFTSGYDSEKPFEIVFYGETDGKLDENKVFGRVTSTLKEVFGNTGIGSGAGEGRTVNFLELLGQPVDIEGTFYLAFEFADNMVITAYDPNLGRSYFATNVVKHATEKSTLYVKPVAVPNNATITADGNWYTVDQLDNTKKGLGAYFILWCKNQSGDIAINANGDVVFALSMDGNNLTVSGTVAGEEIRIYDVNGMLITSVMGQANSTVISVANLNDGVYIVNTVTGTGKFIK